MWFVVASMMHGNAPFSPRFCWWGWSRAQVAGAYRKVARRLQEGRPSSRVPTFKASTHKKDVAMRHIATNLHVQRLIRTASSRLPALARAYERRRGGAMSSIARLLVLRQQVQ